tara:strand:- start:501 stop:2516 length:2016 start_codon:yes stop_codon:yes gene_type:complete
MGKLVLTVVIFLLSNIVFSQSEYSEEVIVSSVGARAIDDIISSTDTVEHEGLDRNISRNLGQILENLPGISSAGFGRAVGRPVIRGLGDYRIQVLENDLGSGDVASSGPDHPHAQNALAISKMEVLKGPSTLRFGPYATSGVVNMLSEHKLLTPESETGGDLIYGYSSVAKEDTFHWHTLRRSGDWFFGFSGHSRDASDYKIPGFEESNAYHEAEEEDEEHARVSGKAKGTGLDEKGLNLHSTFLGDELKTTFFFNTNKSLFGVPGHQHHEEEHEESGEEIVQLDMKRDRFGFEINQVLKGRFENVLFSSSYTDYRHKELENKKVGTEFENSSYNLRTEFTHTLFNDQSGLFGFSHHEEDFTIHGVEKYLPSFTAVKSAVFGVQNYENNQILLESAARIDRASLDPEGSLISYSDTASSFSIGGGYKPIDGALFGLSVARNQRTPSSAELYANGPHIGPQVYEVGSVNSSGVLLDKETAIASEIYFRYSRENWHFHSSAYFNEFNDFVYGDFTGAKKDGLSVINYKQQDASINGLEIELEYFSGQIGLFDINHHFSFSHIHAELGSGKHIPRIPPSTYQYSLEGISGNWMWLCRLRHAAKQNHIAVNELATDSYSQVDVEVSWIPSQLEGFTFSLIARNLGDEEIRNHTSYLKDRLPEPGRNINFTVSYGF